MYLTATTTYNPATGLYRAAITTAGRIVTLYGNTRETALVAALRALGLPEHFNA